MTPFLGEFSLLIQARGPRSRGSYFDADPHLEGVPVQVEGPFGVSFDPLTWTWSRSADAQVNYMMTVAKA